MGELRQTAKAAIEHSSDCAVYNEPALPAGSCDCPAEGAVAAGTKREALINQMVGRFLGWSLPKNFRPDGGISFDPVGNPGTEHAYVREPRGTNLLDAVQAKALILYLLEGPE